MAIFQGEREKGRNWPAETNYDQKFGSNFGSQVGNPTLGTKKKFVAN